MNKEEILNQVEKAIGACRKCRLYRTATQAVPGSGNPNARIIFIGEAPGFNEDQQGLPFVGRAGRLLDELLSEIGLRRADVWIGNVIKHRPPENRDPMIDEIRACKPFIIDQIKALNPRIIATLGRFAMEVFLPSAKISAVHGKAFKGLNRVIYPLYHPAAALRSESVLKELRRDFRNLVNVVKLEDGEISRYNPDGEEAGAGQMLLF